MAPSFAPSYPSYPIFPTRNGKTEYYIYILHSTDRSCLITYTTHPSLPFPSFLFVHTYSSVHTYRTYERRRKTKKNLTLTHGHGHAYPLHAVVLRLLFTLINYNTTTQNTHSIHYYSILLHLYNKLLPCNLFTTFHLPSFSPFSRTDRPRHTLFPLPSTFHRRSSTNSHRSSPPTAIISKLPSNLPRPYFSEWLHIYHRNSKRAVTPLSTTHCARTQIARPPSHSVLS